MEGYANAETMERGVRKAPSSSRRRCPCGCGQRATHAGHCNGITLVMGCEMYVRRWAKRYIW